MTRTSLAISAFALAASLCAATTSFAQSDEPSNDKLVIVNGNTGHVIYDDGYDDLFCVTRRHIVGYTYWGQAIHRRTMHCR